MAKKIINYDPFETLFSLRDDFDRMFRNFTTGFSSHDISRRAFPLLDIKETPDKIVIEAEIPGMDKKDIKISLKNEELVIEGEKLEEEKKKNESFLRIERSYGKFRRTLKLPAAINDKKIKASYENGILKVLLPKTEEEKPKEIPIKVT